MIQRGGLRRRSNLRSRYDKEEEKKRANGGGEEPRFIKGRKYNYTGEEGRFICARTPLETVFPIVFKGENLKNRFACGSIKNNTEKGL